MRPQCSRDLPKALLGIFISFTSYADNTNEIFTCYANDESGLQYNYQSQYKREAINKAYAVCKSQSKTPKTCKTSEANCQSSINGVSTTQFWKCTALDQMAKEWESNLYTQKYDAAIAAKDYCKSKSSMPSTCYVNLLTCKNLNE